ncbi:MAG: hypothetical protein GWN84_18695, partial [Gammaproteobacteria bacterium]|nr:hypothetical protein [Gammaproteobacteria bacterium]NIV52949.1 hypothetical protein [Gammaproteobacteria bacterium]
MTAEFGAPWGTSVKVITSLVVVILAGVGYLLTRGAPETDALRVAIALGLASLLVGCVVFTIRGYALVGRTLRIHRLWWDTELELNGLREVAFDPAAMRWSLRLFGNGGCFAITGWFRSRSLGRYRAFVMDPRRAVVL